MRRYLVIAAVLAGSLAVPSAASAGSYVTGVGNCFVWINSPVRIYQQPEVQGSVDFACGGNGETIKAYMGVEEWKYLCPDPNYGDCQWDWGVIAQQSYTGYSSTSVEQTFNLLAPLPRSYGIPSQEHTVRTVALITIAGIPLGEYSSDTATGGGISPGVSL